MTELPQSQLILRDPTGAEIGLYLATRTGIEMVQLMQAMRDPGAQAMLTSVLLAAPPRAPQTKVPLEKAKKALNAFVAFRCYYIGVPIFKPWPMKKLSNPMSIIWDTDPNKSLWSLMAKAWSIIRDQTGKDKAPLDQFLSLVCEHLQIPSPENYLELMGWHFVTDATGSPTVTRDPLLASVSYDMGAAAVATSVEDIINYVQSQGYAQGYTFESSITSSTFIGHSAGPINAADRLAARNKRRTRRQIVPRGDPSTAEQLRASVKAAHILGGYVEPPPPPPQAAGSIGSDESPVDFNAYEPFNFYDDITNHLTNTMIPAGSHINNGSQFETGSQHEYGSEQNNEYDQSGWGPFRVGADEGVAMPTFWPDHM